MRKRKRRKKRSRKRLELGREGHLMPLQDAATTDYKKNHHNHIHTRQFHYCGTAIVCKPIIASKDFAQNRLYGPKQTFLTKKYTD